MFEAKQEHSTTRKGKLSPEMGELAGFGVIFPIG
jgi:hypothetical protein